jgi:hypothetical protein
VNRYRAKAASEVCEKTHTRDDLESHPSKNEGHLTGNVNDITLFFERENLEGVREFIASDELKTKMAGAASKARIESHPSLRWTAFGAALWTDARREHWCSPTGRRIPALSRLHSWEARNLFLPACI